MIDTPDRRLTRASLELVSREAAQKSTQVTVVLPRRGYAPLLGRILHDRTADKIAEVISQVPNAAATIIPFDVESRVHLLHARQAARLAAQAGDEQCPRPEQWPQPARLPPTGPRVGRARRPHPFRRRKRLSRGGRHRGAERARRIARPRGGGYRDQRAERRAQGDRRGQGPVGGDPPGREQLRVRRHGRRRDRDAHGQVLRPDEHPRLRAGRRASGSRGRCPCAKAARP